MHAKIICALTIAVAKCASAAPLVVGFDDLQTGQSYQSGGYLFTGAWLMRDTNFGPALRVYGNTQLVVSRIDGTKFTLEAIDVLYESSGTNWWLDSGGRGASLTKVGAYDLRTWTTGQVFDSVFRVSITDPHFSGGNYYVFDNFRFTTHDDNASPSIEVSEPATAALCFSAIVAMTVSRHRRRNRK